MRAARRVGSQDQPRPIASGVAAIVPRRGAQPATRDGNPGTVFQAGRCRGSTPRPAGRSPVTWGGQDQLRFREVPRRGQMEPDAVMHDGPQPAPWHMRRIPGDVHAERSLGQVVQQRWGGPVARRHRYTGPPRAPRRRRGNDPICPMRSRPGPTSACTWRRALQASSTASTESSNATTSRSSAGIGAIQPERIAVDDVERGSGPSTGSAARTPPPVSSSTSSRSRRGARRRRPVLQVIRHGIGLPNRR